MEKKKEYGIVCVDHKLPVWWEMEKMFISVSQSSQALKCHFFCPQHKDVQFSDRGVKTKEREKKKYIFKKLESENFVLFFLLQLY